MGKALPELSRLELQCLRCLGRRGEGLIREVLADLPHATSYSTVRKIFERLEEKGAIVRVRREGRAWIYQSSVSSAAMIRREVRRLVDRLFDGEGAPLVAQLADMDAITLEDLREIEDAPSEWFPLWTYPPKTKTAPRVRTEYSQDEYTRPEDRLSKNER